MGFILVLMLLVSLLSTLFGRKSKKEKDDEKSGRITMRQPSGVGFGMLALSLIIMGFIVFVIIMMVASGDGAEAWAESGPMIVLVVGIVALMVLAAGWYCYYLRAYTMVFDQEKIVISKPFKKDEEIPWSSLSRIELETARSILYDKYGQVRLKVGAGWENFGLFCEVARKRIEANRNGANT
ncbi:MAG: hypothetical protein J1E01_01855 [Acetatifactor sp.]|nr:hypothetical protein [Acetatifactor sp.]